MANQTELPNSQKWTMRFLFAILASLILFGQLLPLDEGPRRWAPPDIILIFALVWSSRRPDFVPAPLIAVIFFLQDLFLLRPPGLYSLMVLLLCEWQKTWAIRPNETNFMSEWLRSAFIFAGFLLSYRLILTVSFSPLPPLSLSLIQMIMNIIFFPIAVFVSERLFNVRKLSALELERQGL